MTWGRTPECNSHTASAQLQASFCKPLHGPLKHTEPLRIGVLTLAWSHCRAPSTPVLSSAVIFTIRVLIARFLGFRADTVFIHFEENCLHRSYCFWLSADLGFTSGSYFSSVTTGKLFFLLNNEFLNDAVEETATRRTCWYAKPPQYAPVWLLCTEWKFNGPCALGAAQQGVYLGEQIAQYHLEQHLFFLPTKTSKSNISIVLATVYKWKL